MLVAVLATPVAKYLLLTSKEIAVDEAYRWGLVHKVAPAPRTEEVALQLATQVADHPPESVARIKSMLHAWDGVEDAGATLEPTEANRLAMLRKYPRFKSLVIREAMNRRRAPFYLRRTKAAMVHFPARQSDGLWKGRKIFTKRIPHPVDFQI